MTTLDRKLVPPERVQEQPGHLGALARAGGARHRLREGALMVGGSEDAARTSGDVCGAEQAIAAASRELGSRGLDALGEAYSGGMQDVLRPRWTDVQRMLGSLSEEDVARTGLDLVQGLQVLQQVMAREAPTSAGH